MKYKDRLWARSAHALLIALSLAGCAAPEAGSDHAHDEVSSGVPTFDEYLASLPRTPNGAYLVEGDMPFTDRDKLRDLYEESISERALSIDVITAPNDSKLSATRAKAMKYCIHDSFKMAFPPTDYKPAVISAMNTAGLAWEAAAGTSGGAAVIDFIYLSAEDTNCVTTNNRIDFVVYPDTAATDYDAAAPFPSDTGTARVLWITKPGLTPGAPITLAGTLKHELGHTLGFRHEHIRVTGDPCGEGTGYRPISPYDQRSVMHYEGVNSSSGPMCGYTATHDWGLTTYDQNGAKCIYNPTIDSCKGMRISTAAPQFTADNNGTVYRYNAANTQIDQYKLPTNGALPAWARLTSISGTRRIMAGGTVLYRVNDADGALSRWNATTSTWTALGSSGAGTAVAYTGGHIYRLNTNGSIDRISSTGTAATPILTIVANGRSLFAGTTNVFRKDSNNSIYQWVSGTTWNLVASSTAASTLTSVAQDRSGVVYTLDTAGVVRKYNMSTTPPTATQIATGVSSIKGGLDTLYATPSAATGTIRRYSSIAVTPWTDYGTNISVFFGGGPRKLARMSGTGGTVAGELFDYLYPSPK